MNLKERALKDSVQILNRIFDYAMKREKIIMDNPVRRLDLQNYYQNCDTSMKSPEDKIFTPEEIEIVKAQIRSEMSGKEYEPLLYPCDAARLSARALGGNKREILFAYANRKPR